MSVAFSPDGKILASVDWDGTIKLWDVASGTLKTTLDGHTGWGYSIAFSPDGTTIANVGRDDLTKVNDTIKLWDVASGTLKTTLDGHTETVDSIAFSPDGTIIASGGRTLILSYGSANKIIASLLAFQIIYGALPVKVNFDFPHDYWSVSVERGVIDLAGIIPSNCILSNCGMWPLEHLKLLWKDTQSTGR